MDINRFQPFSGLLMLYHGHSALYTDRQGRVGKGLEGFYHHQTRFLSALDLTVDGRAVVVASANAVDHDAAIAYALAPLRPDDAAADEIAEKALEIQVNYFLNGGLHLEVQVTNHALEAAEATLELRLAADFADISEAAREVREQCAPVAVQWDAEHRVWQATYGHVELPHATRVHVEAAHEPAWDGERLRFALSLAPREQTEITLGVVPSFCGEATPLVTATPRFRARGVTPPAADPAVTRLVTPNARVQAAWDRAAYDLASLALGDGAAGRERTPAAGIPYYQALFGRDTLTAAWQSSLLDARMLEDTVATIGAWLGTKDDPRHDEQPGRVIHQRQLSPLSLLGRNPYLHYWGDYAGPGMFLVSLGWHFSLTGDRAFFRRHRDEALRCLEWMDRDGDRDQDGFYEYDTRAGDWGTKNQGWKDSPEAILYPDGRQVPNPIVPVEIQGYYYAAKQLMGLCFLFMGEAARGLELLGQAQALKRRFNEAFWLPDEGFYALALDPDKRPVASIASNAGHCLACGIVDHDKAAAVAGRLMAPDMFSGWGIRTLSSEHPAYNPFVYHLGSVWPSENGSIALGLKRYGFGGLAADLAKGLFDATALFSQDRLPEAMGGHARDRAHPHPGIYPRACAPQAWSASAVIMLVQAIAGLLPVAPLGVLLIDPELPDWLPALTLENLRVGDTRLSLRLWRDASGHTEFEVFDRRGKLRVVRQPPPDSVNDGIFSRLGDLAGSLWPLGKL